MRYSRCFTRRTLELFLGFFFVSMTSLALADSFSETWEVTKSGPYNVWPQHEVSLSSLYDGSVSLIERAANRTLSSDRDTLPRFNKLVHPIGVCFSGSWNITAENPYSGYFSKGSRAPIIVRASEAMGKGRYGSWRSFGLAGKIFSDDGKTGNFFTIDDLGGTDARHFLDTAKTNEPAISSHVSSVFSIRTLLTIAKAFSRADSNPAFRPLYQISELGGASPVNTPHWLMLRSLNHERSDAVDFRDELNLRNYRDGLKFEILVSEAPERNWESIGFIQLTEEAASEGCDHRLHFGHPKSRD